jgi:hypothetical protein
MSLWHWPQFCSCMDVAVTALAGDRAVTLDARVHAVMEGADLLLMAGEARFETHRSEVVARVLDAHRIRVAVDAVEPLVGAGRELRRHHRDVASVIALGLCIVVALKALRVRDLLDLLRRRLGRIRDCSRSGILCRARSNAGQRQQQRRKAMNGDEIAEIAGPEHG